MMSKGMILKLLLIPACLLMLTPTASLADMILDKAILYFTPDKPKRQDVVVKNTADKPLFLQVTPYLILKPGTDQKSREKITNPNESGLLVSPNKLVIPPKGRKIIRFLNLQPRRNQEGVYRVTIVPVKGKLQAKKTGLKVLIGYEVLILAQPANPNSELIANRDGRSLKLSNKGNTSIALTRGKQCPAESPSAENCTSLQNQFLYSGSELTVTLPHDEPVEYHLAIGSNNSLRSIP